MRKKLIIKGQEGLNLLNPNGPTTITLPSTFIGNNIGNVSSPIASFSNLSTYQSALKSADKAKGLTGFLGKAGTLAKANNSLGKDLKNYLPTE